MKELNELIDVNDSAWIFLKEWISKSKNQCEILNKNQEKSKDTLYFLQISTKSTLGAIAYETGGLKIDNGWLRILGSGNEEICENLIYWNEIKTNKFKIEGALIIAYDIIGGFFAINSGAFEGKMGNIFYFYQDSLEWENLEIGYTDFINWALNGDLKKFYEDFRWSSWRNDINNLKGNDGIHLYPPLFTKEGKDIEKVSKRAVNIEEIWKSNNEILKNL